MEFDIERLVAGSIMVDKLVSVIIPFYKEIHLVSRAVESAITQELPLGWKLEIVVGNDGSFSAEEIVGACGHLNAEMKVIKNHDANGAGNARNAAIKASQGSVLAFLDADDYWLPGKLIAQLAMISKGLNFTATGYQFRGTDTIVTPPESVKSAYQFFRQLSVGTSTVVVAKSLLSDQLFSNLRFSQDTEFWARLFSSRPVVFGSTSSIFTIYEPSGRTANKAVQFFRFRDVVQMFKFRALQRFVIYTSYTLRGIGNHFLKARFGRAVRTFDSIVGRS